MFPSSLTKWFTLPPIGRCPTFDAAIFPCQGGRLRHRLLPHYQRLTHTRMSRPRRKEIRRKRPPPPPPPPPVPMHATIARLRKEALEPAHLVAHFPKNPFCEWCQRGGMTSKRVRHWRQDPDVPPDEEPPTAYGQKISTDTYAVANPLRTLPRPQPAANTACRRFVMATPAPSCHTH